MYPCEGYGFQAKEARLILGSGIYYIFCYQYFERYGLSESVLFFVGCTAMYPCEGYGFQAKEARLILGSGIYYIFCYQYFERYGLSFSGS